MLSERERSGTLVDRERENVRCGRDVDLYGTGIIFEEPNPTGIRQSDLIRFKNSARRHRGVGEEEVTATSGLHAQAERTKKTEKRRGSYMATSDVDSDKGPEPGVVAQSRRRPARGRGRAFPTT